MSELELIRAKTVVINVIKKRIDDINKDLEKYGEGWPMVRENCKINKLKLSNLQTEICIGLDKEFEK